MVVLAARLVRAVRALKFRTRVASSPSWTGGRAHLTPAPAAAFRAPAPARFPLAHARQQQQQHRLLCAAPRATLNGGRLPIVPGGGDDDEDDDEVYVSDEDDEDGAEEYEDAEEEAAETVIRVVNVGGGGGGPPGGATEVSVDVCVMDASMGGGGALAADFDTGDAAMDAAALAERLTADAEKLIRWVLSPPEGSQLPRDLFPGPKCVYAELSVALCSDDYIQSLNAEWRGMDAATDVLSFPQDSFGEVVVLGDCVISLDTAKRQAEDMGQGHTQILPATSSTRILNPQYLTEYLSYVASYDVASNICQALNLGTGYTRSAGCCWCTACCTSWGSTTRRARRHGLKTVPCFSWHLSRFVPEAT